MKDISYDLREIPKNNGQYNWFKGVGHTIYFNYKEKDDSFIILRHFTENSSFTNSLIEILYHNEKHIINAKSILNAVCFQFIKDQLIDWKYDVGERICNNNHSFEIIDRKAKVCRKYYKIKCLLCGFDSNTPYYKNHDRQLHTEYWVLEQKLEDMDCPVCGYNVAFVAPGINDIATVASWMIQYFVDKTDCQKYNIQSKSQLNMNCIYCNKHKMYNPKKLYVYKHLPCTCEDHISIPNKIAYTTFMKLYNANIIQNYINEYSPEWANRYRYDNYFESNGKKYIIEMDGGIGHGNSTFKSNKQDIDGLIRDKIKDQLAKEHDIELHRIDCNTMDYELIYQRLYNNLAYIIQEELNIDMCEILSQSYSNFMKKVCDYYEDNNHPKLDIVAKEFNISLHTIKHYLKRGREIGWCNYLDAKEKRKEDQNIVFNLLRDNPSLTYYRISKITNIPRTSVKRYYDQFFAETY